jgi:hypothetical protein
MISAVLQFMETKRWRNATWDYQLTAPPASNASRNQPKQDISRGEVTWLREGLGKSHAIPDLVTVSSEVRTHPAGMVAIKLACMKTVKISSPLL